MQYKFTLGHLYDKLHEVGGLCFLAEILCRLLSIKFKKYIQVLLQYVQQRNKTDFKQLDPG